MKRWTLCLACFWAIQAGVAAAQPSCETLPGTKIYMRIGDTQEPLIKALGRALRNSPMPVTLVYVLSSSCVNVEATYTRQAILENGRYLPSLAENPAFNPNADASPTCTMPAGGAQIDVGISATFVSSCATFQPAAGIEVQKFTGPIQAYLFGVLETSTQSAITAEEGYMAFGLGTSGGVTPWNDETLLFIRPQTTSTALTTSAAIRVPAAKLKGVRYQRTGELLTAMLPLAAVPDSAEKAIGIIGAEIYDARRDTLNALAFRAYGQRYAYYPDSTPTATDKANVRDGHYFPWSPVELMVPYATIGPNIGQPVREALSRYVVDLILGLSTSIDPGFEPLNFVVDKGLVPVCAMKVTREFEGGDFSLYSPPEPCHCFYESRVGVSNPACLACSANQPCASGVCRHGFCEAQ